MKKLPIKFCLSIPLFLGLLLSCTNNISSEDEEVAEEGYADGTYCAEVEYHNPNTGTENTYTLEVEVESNQVTQINWNNGGWLDEDHFTPAELDAEGKCSFSSDRGYDYTIEIIGEHCNNLDSEGQYTKLNLPKYPFEEAAAMYNMTQEEINDCNIFSEGDVLSENDMITLQNEIKSIRQYLAALHGYDQGYEQEIADIKQSQNKLQSEIKNGYIQSIRKSGINQVLVITKNGVNYELEVRGSDKCTMGTAQFNENTYEWQMVYIKQYPDVEKYSGHYMRIIDSGF